MKHLTATARRMTEHIAVEHSFGHGAAIHDAIALPAGYAPTTDVHAMGAATS